MNPPPNPPVAREDEKLEGLLASREKDWEPQGSLSTLNAISIFTFGCKSTDTRCNLPPDAVPPASQTQGDGVLLWSSTLDHLAITNLAYILPNRIKPHLFPTFIPLAFPFSTMTSTIDPGTIGKARPRKHVRSLTGTCRRLLMPLLTSNLTNALGYFAEVDESGKEKWPRGEEKVWKEGLRAQDTGRYSSAHPTPGSAPLSISPSVIYRARY